MRMSAVAQQHDGRGVLGQVGAGAHGDAQVGRGQGRGVVDAVAHHGHHRARGLEPPHGLGLARGQALPPGTRPPPGPAPMCWVAAWVSPDSSTVRMPRARRARTRAAASGRGWSPKARQPQGWPATAAKTTVSPSACQRRACAPRPRAGHPLGRHQPAGCPPPPAGPGPCRPGPCRRAARGPARARDRALLPGVLHQGPGRIGTEPQPPYPNAFGGAAQNHGCSPHCPSRPRPARCEQDCLFHIVSAFGF